MKKNLLTLQFIATLIFNNVANAQWLNSGSNVFLTTSTDKVGIGTSTPSLKLQIDEGNVLIRGLNNFSSTGDEAALNLGGSGQYISAFKNGAIAIFTPNAGCSGYCPGSAISISDNGKITIPSTASGNNLEVYGKTLANDQVTIESLTTTSLLYNSILHVENKRNFLLAGYFSTELPTFLTNLPSEGIYAKAKGSKSSNTGVEGYAEGDCGEQLGYGVIGTATNAVANYGIYGSAYNDVCSGLTGTNYSIFGLGGSSGGLITSYAGYFVGDIGGTGTFSYTSDRKLKKDIEEISNGLVILKQLKPSEYYFKTDEFDKMNLATGKHFGLIAQDLQKVLPELVKENTFPAQYDRGNGNKTFDEVKYLGVNYIELLPIIIKSIQEQQTEVENLTGELLSLKKNLDDLKNENINLKQEKEENISLNKKSKLFQNQPNPFNTNSIIKLFVAENASIFSLNIYDINGIKVKSFNNLTL